jgi:predicted phage terminase large subunit-like protein
MGRVTHRYSSIPGVLHGEHHEYAIGVDLAISQSDAADCTAMVTLDRRGWGRKTKIYVLPRPVNRRMTFNQTIDTIHLLNDRFHRPKFYVESVAYQESAVQALKADGLNAIGVKPRADKRSRLNMIADKIERGIVLFPETGCEELLAQLTGFGVEKHDDLVDALTMSILELMNEERTSGSMRIGSNTIWSKYGIRGPHRRG